MLATVTPRNQSDTLSDLEDISPNTSGLQGDLALTAAELTKMPGRAEAAAVDREFNPRFPAALVGCRHGFSLGGIAGFRRAVSPPVGGANPLGLFPGLSFLSLGHGYSLPESAQGAKRGSLRDDDRYADDH